MANLDELKTNLAKKLFIDPTQRRAAGLCIQCGELALDKCYSDAGRREYGISGLCEECFDKIFNDETEN